jgi:formylmethanofuran dehydrogenase subunit E
MNRPFIDEAKRDFEYWDQELNRRLERRPYCEICGEHIQDEFAFYHDGTWICERCIKENTTSLDDYDLDY